MFENSRLDFSNLYRRNYDRIWNINVGLKSLLKLNKACRNLKFIVTYCMKLETLLDGMIHLRK